MAIEKSSSEFEAIAQELKAEERLGRRAIVGFLGPPVVAIGTMFASGEFPMTGGAWESFLNGVQAVGNVEGGGGAGDAPASELVRSAAPVLVRADAPSERAFFVQEICNAEARVGRAVGDEVFGYVMWVGDGVLFQSGT